MPVESCLAWHVYKVPRKHWGGKRRGGPCRLRALCPDWPSLAELPHGKLGISQDFTPRAPAPFTRVTLQKQLNSLTPLPWIWWKCTSRASDGPNPLPRAKETLGTLAGAVLPPLSPQGSPAVCKLVASLQNPHELWCGFKFCSSLNGGTGSVSSLFNGWFAETSAESQGCWDHPTQYRLGVLQNSPGTFWAISPPSTVPCMPLTICASFSTPGLLWRKPRPALPAM